jgi:hypothetical protein
MVPRRIGFSALAGFARARTRALRLIAAIALAASGCDDGKCKQEQRVAIELTVRNTAGRNIEVSAELDGGAEQSCDRISDLNVGVEAGGRIYTCIEQGGGTYKVRVYEDDTVIYEEDIEVEADECHIKELVRAEVDLAAS